MTLIKPTWSPSVPIRTSAKNRMQEITEPYLKEIRWDNATLERDMKAFWVAAWKCWQRKTEYEYKRFFEWAKGKELHPKQIIRAMSL